MMDASLWSDILLPVAERGFDILVKASIVLLAAGATTTLLRSRSAAARYAVWSAALGTLIALPLFSMVLPPLQVDEAARVPAAPPPSRDVVSVEVVKAIDFALPFESGDTADLQVRERDLSPWVGISVPWSILAAVWFAGILIMLVRLTLHVVCVNRITALGRTADGCAISGIARRCAMSLGIRRRVRVIFSDNSRMPFSWGVVRPVVILPSSAEAWPEEQTHSVLLHELAHVARWDYPVHLLIEIARALYWPNPLVWLAARRSALERERACDDCALRCGTPSEAYATHLLEIARMQVEQFPLGATTMAGEPGLLERMRSVLNERLDRSPPKRRSLLAGACLTLVAVAPLAALDLLGTEQPWVIPTVEELTDDLSNHDDLAVRRRAAWWLGEHEVRSTTGALIEALNDASPDVRLAAGWALGEIKDPETVSSLVRVLEDDPDPRVREMAALALGEINDPRAVDPLATAFGREEGLRGAIVWALGEIRDDQARAVREAAFAEWDRAPWMNQEVWAGALEDGSDFSEDTERLLEWLRTGDSEERRLTAWNLGFLGVLDGLDTVEPVVDGLLDALRDPCPEVRAAAIWALDEINPSRSVRARRGQVDRNRLRENRLNQLGYYLVFAGHTDRAIDVFRANVMFHPESWNCYDSLGEAYAFQGDIEQSLECYEKALELNPGDERISRMLEELREHLRKDA